MAYESKDGKKPRKSSSEKLLDRARRCFAQSSAAWERQRIREKEDLRFQVPELQWDDDSRRAREADTNAGIPARPTLSISLLDQPIQLVLNQERQAHLGVNIHPLSEDADEETAKILQGLYRQIERDSPATQARTHAFDRAVKAGTGCYRVNTKYDDMGGKPFDQIIVLERILYQDAVYFDPSAKKPDFSDAEYAFVTEWVPLERFKAEYPKAKISTQSDFEFSETIRETPEWVRMDGKNKAILKAEFWYKDYEDEAYVALTDGRAIQKDELDEDTLKLVDDSIPERIKKATVISHCILTASEVLEEHEWNGHFIPLIPVFGRELQAFDAERRFVGMIRPAKDAQRTFNYSVSTAVEVAALEPKSPFLGVAGTFQGFENQWKQANIRNWPYLEYNPVNVRGEPAPPPQRTPIDSSKMTVSMGLMQVGKDGVQTTTATFDPSLGDLPTKDRSGKAIMALQSQGDAGNSHFLHNLADVSMAYEAKVVLDLIPAIYDRPGRMAKILDEQDNSKTVLLNEPHTVNPQTKMPQRLMAPPTPQPSPDLIKNYDLRKGTYGVDVSIGKSWQTRMEQGSDKMGEILQARPELLSVIGDVWANFQDWPGADELTKRLRKMIEKTNPGLLDEEDGPPSPEALQAKVQAQEQQIQQMGQQLQQASMAIQTDQAKQQATLQKAQMDNQTKVAIAQQDAQIKLLIAKVNAMAKLMDTRVTYGHEKDMQARDAAHDIEMAALEPHPAEGSAPFPEFAGPNPTPLGSEESI